MTTKERNHDWYIRNKERLTIKQRVYNKEHRDEIRERQRIYNDIHRNEIKEWRQSLQGCFSEYKTGAKKREHVFELSFEQFESLVKKPCYYCGKDKAMGLDQIIAGKGYALNNIVPCCTMCNRMKLNYSQKAFLQQCRRISDLHDN